MPGPAPSVGGTGVLLHAGFVQARREALVLLIDRELDHAAIEQILVDLPALNEIVDRMLALGAEVTPATSGPSDSAS